VRAIAIAGDIDCLVAGLRERAAQLIGQVAPVASRGGHLEQIERAVGSLPGEAAVVELDLVSLFSSLLLGRRRLQHMSGDAGALGDDAAGGLVDDDAGEPHAAA